MTSSIKRTVLAGTAIAALAGSAKGLWYHGTRIATGSKGTYKTTGWVKASAFC
jgi:hypothetical protein